MTMSTSALRSAWKDYEADTTKMEKVSIGGHNLIFAIASLDAWKALDTVLTAHSYKVRKADTGSYNNKLIAGTKVKSLHAYGIAVDINWSTNMVKNNPKEPMRFSNAKTQEGRENDYRAGYADTDMSREMIGDILAIRTNEGKRVFEWGNWTTKIDPMHFELDVTPADLDQGINPATVRDVVDPVPNETDVYLNSGEAGKWPDLVLNQQKYAAADRQSESQQFLNAHEWIAKWEGGFANHKDDPGGATNWGITQAVLASWRGHPVSVADVQALTLEEARKIFHVRYWLPMKLDQIAAPSALMAYNCGTNSGPGRGAALLQTAIARQGIAVQIDGSIGPQTIAGANAADQSRLVSDYAALYEAYYRSLSIWPVFGKGWMNRLRDVTSAAKVLAGVPMTTAVFAEKLVEDTQSYPPVTAGQLPQSPDIAHQSAAVSAPKPVQLNAIDATLGGELLKGKKTLIAGIIAPLLFAAYNHGLIDVSQETFNSIMGLVAAFGGLGLASKLERSKD